MRMNGDADLETIGSDELYETFRILGAFDVKSDHAGTCIGKRLNELLGIREHEMHVKEHVRVFSYAFNDRYTDREIINEMTVHDIKMKVVCRSFNSLDITHEISEISSKNRRRYLKITHFLFLRL